MNMPNQRTIFRWIHIFLSIPILGYIYSPFEKLPDYAFATRFVFLPVMVLTGLWMWKGHVLRRFYFETTGLTGQLQRAFSHRQTQLEETTRKGSMNCELCDE